MRLLKWCGGLMAPTFMVVALSTAGCDNGEGEMNTGATGGTNTESQVAEQPKPATQPIIPLAQIADWCPEHGVPESVCTRCNEALIAEFKAKGDWDEKHNLPKSQCFECDPSLKQKFAAAYKEKYGKEPPAMEEEHDHEHEEKGEAKE